MSGIQPTLFTPDDPEFFAELLSKTVRTTDQRQPYCPDVPDIQGVDGALAKRLQTLLDVVADISLCQRQNVSAAMARLGNDSGDLLETRLFIAFNHKNDENARRCPGHLMSIFGMLREVPDKSANDSPKAMTDNLTGEFIEICRAIHNYSYEIFAHRVMKRASSLLVIQEYINQDKNQDQPRFKSGQHSTLQMFLEQVDLIIEIVTSAEATKQFTASSMECLLSIYQCWTASKYNLIPKDGLTGFAKNKVTLLDQVDEWLDEGA